uniref:Uncharacterized protein n=1 Tax=Acrobeloides nanus TaxID=290746 RepID=A0A914DPZ0_9BILA
MKSRLSEQREERTVYEVYECPSKAKGGIWKKSKKGPVAGIVDDTTERKRQFGPELPLANEELDEDELLELVVYRFEEVLQLDSDKEDFQEGEE